MADVAACLAAIYPRRLALEEARLDRGGGVLYGWTSTSRDDGMREFGRQLGLDMDRHEV